MPDAPDRPIPPQSFPADAGAFYGLLDGQPKDEATVATALEDLDDVFDLIAAKLYSLASMLVGEGEAKCAAGGDGGCQRGGFRLPGSHRGAHEQPAGAGECGSGTARRTRPRQSGCAGGSCSRPEPASRTTTWPRRAFRPKNWKTCLPGRSVTVCDSGWKACQRRCARFCAARGGRVHGSGDGRAASDARRAGSLRMDPGCGARGFPPGALLAGLELLHASAAR